MSSKKRPTFERLPESQKVQKQTILKMGIPYTSDLTQRMMCILINGANKREWRDKLKNSGLWKKGVKRNGQ